MQSDRIRIVLIDDNELTRGALRLALPMETVEVVGEASTGRTGLEACLREKPDIIFLDVMMPDMDGLEILPAIRDALPMADVLMVTASNDRRTIETAIMGGAAGYIVKPFKAGTVEDAVRKSVANLARKKAEQLARKS